MATEKELKGGSLKEAANFVDRARTGPANHGSPLTTPPPSAGWKTNGVPKIGQKA